MFDRTDVDEANDAYERSADRPRAAQPDKYTGQKFRVFFDGQYHVQDYDGNVDSSYDNLADAAKRFNELEPGRDNGARGSHA